MLLRIRKVNMWCELWQIMAFGVLSRRRCKTSVYLQFSGYWNDSSSHNNEQYNEHYNITLVRCTAAAVVQQ